MRYCIDISAIPYGTGVSRYTANLAEALRNQIKNPDTLSFFGTSLRQFASLHQLKSEIKPDTTHFYPLPPKVSSYLFNQTSVPIDPFIGGADVFHSWDWYLPKSNKTKVVTTVHDLALFKYPDIAHPEIKAHHELVLKRISQFSPQIIAVSQATKNDLIELFDIPPENITVIYEALPKESEINLTDDVIQKLHIKKPFLLMVGTKEPRKNFKRQIEAWRVYKKEYDLVLVGKSAWDTIQSEDGLHQVGQLESQDLAGLYRQAQGFMYCSLAEGFGLPILEAFFHECPVLTSNCSSLIEIAGDAAITVDPMSVEEISAGITKMLDKRDQLIHKGKHRLQAFSWEKAAQETLKVYKKAINL